MKTSYGLLPEEMGHRTRTILLKLGTSWRGVAPRLALAWLLSTSMLALFEWTLLIIREPEAFAGWRQRFLMFPLEFGNLLPYTLAGLTIWGMVRGTALLLQPRIRWPRACAALVWGLLVVPYAISLSRFTYSGARARELDFHSVLVAGTAVMITLAAAAAGWAHLYLETRARLRTVAGAALAFAAGATLLLSASILPNEYEPLHAFLGFSSVLLATWAGHGFASAIRLLSRALLIVAISSLVTWGLISAAILARADEYAWILWGETAASRYITTRWTFLAPANAAVNKTFVMQVKPRLETAQTVAWRKRRASEPAPHIVIFSIDGLRPDHVGTYGYTKHPTTPNIDRFAKQGAVFENAHSSYPVTQNFNSSLLLGRFVPKFGAHRPPVAYQEHAITRILKRRAYHILVNGWFEHSSRNDFDSAVYQIDRNLPKATLRQRRTARRMPYIPYEKRFKDVATHLDEAKAKGLPALIWMHLLGPHPKKGGGFTYFEQYPFGDSMEDHYDSSIANTDAWLGRLEQMMAERLNDGRPIIWILCSDHGINLHGKGTDLYRTRVHVPLVIVAPGVRPQRLRTPVDVSLDLAASIVDLVGFEPPKSFDGVSLIPIMKRGDVIDEMKTRIIPLARAAWRGAVYGSFKFLEYRDSVSLFDITKDPEEKHNVAAKHPELVEQLRSVVALEIARREREYVEGSREHSLPASVKTPQADQAF